MDMEEDVGILERCNAGGLDDVAGANSYVCVNNDFNFYNISSCNFVSNSLVRKRDLEESSFPGQSKDCDCVSSESSGCSNSDSRFCSSCGRLWKRVKVSSTAQIGVKSVDSYRSKREDVGNKVVKSKQPADIRAFWKPLSSGGSIIVNKGAVAVTKRPKDATVLWQANRGYVVDGTIQLPMIRAALMAGSYDGRWPPLSIRTELQVIYSLFIVKQSTIPDSGIGLFAYKNFAAGEVIGVYGGTFSRIITPYTLTLAWKHLNHIDKDCDMIDGTPSKVLDHTVFGRMNDYIWDVGRNNVDSEDQGVLRAVRPIAAGEELFMHYGDAYCWDQVKSQGLSKAIDAIELTARKLSSRIATEVSDICKMWRLSVTNFRFETDVATIALFLLYHGTGRNYMLLHGFHLEDYGQPGIDIIAQIICSETFYRHMAFREPFSLVEYKTDWIDDLAVIPAGHNRRGQQQRNYFESPEKVIKSKSRTTGAGTALSFPDKYVPPVGSEAIFKGVVKNIDGLRSLLVRLGEISRIIFPTVGILVTQESDDTPVSLMIAEDPPCVAACQDESNLAASISWDMFPDFSPDSESEKVDMESTPVSQSYFHDKVTEIGNSADGFVNIASFNCGTLNDGKWLNLLTKIESLNIDLLVLLDTRHHASDLNRWTWRMNEFLGKGFRIEAISPAAERVHKSLSIGGQIIVISPRLSQVSFKEVIKCGALSSVTFRAGRNAYKVISTYWPNEDSGPFSLMAKLKNEFHDPITALKESIWNLVEDDSVSIKVLMGDFNSDVNPTATRKDRYKLGSFVESIKFRHTSLMNELNFPSFRQDSALVKGSSRIDYSFVAEALDVEAISKVVELQNFLNDHLLLLTSVKETEMTKKGKCMNMLPNLDINIRNEAAVLKFSEAMKKGVFKSKDPAVILQEIGRWSVKHTPAKNKYTKKNCWSPKMMTLTIALRAVVTIRRFVNGYRRYPKWTEANYKDGLRVVRKRWRWQLDQLRKSLPPDDSENFMYNWDYFNKVTWAQLQSVPDAAMNDLRKKLHGKERSKMRAEINEYVDRLEENRKAGRLGFVIQSLLGTRRDPFGMEMIMDNDSVITDPKVIAKLIRDHFFKWFRDEKKASKQFPAGAHLTPWLDHDSTWEEFHTAHQGKGIPDDLIKLLWEAARSKNVASDFRNEELMTAPTLEELQSAIKHTKTNSTGGVSGLTNNMMKCWPDELVAQVHSALSKLWLDNRKIPDYFKWKWLVPIPKVKNPTINDLRPLALVEVLRKAWIGIFVRRIQKRWEKFGVLEEDQHGFRPHRGTDSAIANMISALESAKEYSSQILLSSWDLKRAFDSVPKDILVWAWMRLGVPRALALYLVEMDYHGNTVVKTPLTAKVNATSGTNGLAQGDWNFTAELGAGQGDIPSPSNWIALFDILLTALRMDGDKGFRTMGPYGFALKINDVGYADDLIVIRANIEAMQRAADIISGFTNLMGLTFSTSKFRAFAVNWGNTIHSVDRDLVVHEENWTPSAIPMLSDGSLKHLGVVWDMDLTSTTMWENAKKMMKESCTRLVYRKAPAICKRIALHISVHKKVGYYAKFICRDLADFRVLDIPCNNLLKKITLNLTSYPNELLYVSTKRGGLGYTQFSEYLQRSKFAVWERMMLVNTQEREIALGIVTREARARGQPVVTFSPIRVSGKGVNTWWLSSCIEWLDELGVYLYIPGQTQEASDEAIEDNWRRNEQPIDKDLLQSYNRYGMFTIGDVTRVENEFDVAPEERVTASFRIGQCWAISDREIWEIVSFDKTPSSVYYQRWIQPQGRRFVVNEKYKLMESPGDAPLRGVASKYKLTADEFGNAVGCMSLQIFLSPERMGKKGTWTSLYSYKSCTPQWYGNIQSIKDLGIHCPANSILFTDGSWEDRAPAGDRLMGVHNYRAGGAVVILGADGRYKGYYTVLSEGQEEYIKAFDMELMMLIVAHMMSNGNKNQIYSDCESAIKVMRDGKWGWKSSKGSLLRSAAARLVNVADITHISAHPERGVNKDRKDLWTAQDKGIYLADLLAGGKFQEFADMTQSEPILITEQRIKLMCVKIAGYGLVLEGKGFFLGSLKELADSVRMKTYLADRDKVTRGIDHNALHPTRHWVGSSTELLASFCRNNGEGEVCSAARNRIGYDKKLTLANKYHYRMVQGREDMKCRFCGNDDTLSHQIATCVRWEVVEARNAAIANVEKSILKLSKKDNKVERALKMYMKILLEVNSGNAWLGLWFDQYVIPIRNAINSCDLNGRQYNMLHKTLKKLHHDAIEIHRTYNNVVDQYENDARIKKESIVYGNCVRSEEDGSDSDESSGVDQEEVRRRERIQEILKKRAARERWAIRREKGATKAKPCEEEAESPRSNQIYKEIIAFDPFSVPGPSEIDAYDTLVTASFVKAKDKWKRRKKKER